MFARSRAVTLFIMYYILRFWGKLKSLTKWMHFNFFFVQNFFNFFLTFPLQFLTFRLTFWKFGKKTKGFQKSIFTVCYTCDQGQIMASILRSCGTKNPATFIRKRSKNVTNYNAFFNGNFWKWSIFAGCGRQV